MNTRHSTTLGSRRPLQDRAPSKSTWAPALDGIGSVYLTYFSDIAVRRGFGRTGQFVAHLLATIFDGHNASLTDGAKEALGRPPKDFKDFARDAARGRLESLIEKG